MESQHKSTVTGDCLIQETRIYFSKYYESAYLKNGISRKLLGQF